MSSSKLGLFLSFFRDIFFDHPNEYKFTHPQFNPKKFMIFLAFLSSISLSCFLINRTILLVKQNQALHAVIEAQQKCTSTHP